MGTTSLCWSVWLWKNTIVFYNKQSFFLQVIISTTHWICTWGIVQWHTSQDILVAASLFFWHRWPRTFLPRHMGGGLLLGLTIISVSGFLSNFYRLCTLWQRSENFQDNVSPQCILLEITKVSLFQKNIFRRSMPIKSCIYVKLCSLIVRISYIL